PFSAPALPLNLRKPCRLRWSARIPPPRLRAEMVLGIRARIAMPAILDAAAQRCGACRGCEGPAARQPSVLPVLGQQFGTVAGIASQYLVAMNRNLRAGQGGPQAPG